jgi:hypothetical protein
MKIEPEKRAKKTPPVMLGGVRKGFKDNNPFPRIMEEAFP